MYPSYVFFCFIICFILRCVMSIPTELLVEPDRSQYSVVIA